MYSNERGNGFSIIDLIVKIVFFGIFIFIMIWLFPKVPNMTPFYSNVFRENVKYMQDAAEAYFTDDKMPKEIGETVKITLAELYEKKLVLPFVDEDGNACNQYDSYVSITKDEEEKYSLKTNLVCDKESDYVIKILGCHTYCKDNKCEKVCEKEQITMYQHKQAVTSTMTSYKCDKGYTRDGKYCYKTVLKDSVSALHEKVTNTTLTMPAKVVTIPAVSKKLDVIKTKIADSQKKVYDDVIVNTTDPKTERKCETHTEKEPYKCNCSTHTVNGLPVTTCNTCYRDVKVEECRNVTTPGTTTYKCPSVSTHSSGKNETLSCWHYEKVDNGYGYSCPAETTDTKGKNETLECYKVTPESTSMECSDKTYDLIAGICSKVVEGTSIEKKCENKDYVLEGDKCNLYKTEKVKAKATKTKKTTYKYTWSEKENLEGWTKTNKTKVVEGEEICK